MEGDSKERRAFRRIKLTLDVEVSSVDRAATYEVRDYCPGGMLLIYKQGPQVLQPSALTKGDRLTISFSLPVRNRPQRFMQEAEVVRAFDPGVGVAFLNPSPATLQALQELAGSAVPATPSQPDTSSEVLTNRQQILSQCRQILSRHLFEILHDFFRQADERLLECAQKASSNQEQSVYFEEIAELTRFRQSVTETFHDAVMERIDALEQPQSFGRDQGYADDQINSFELSIVDKEEFESWVLVSAMISKIESRFSGELFDLLQRLTALTGIEGVDKENNPLGPAVICRAFCEALKVLRLQLAHVTELYVLFEQIVMPHLARLYHDLSNLFVKAGVLPVIKRKPKILETPSGAQPKASAVRGGASGDATGQEDAGDSITVADEEAYQVAMNLLKLQKRDTGETDKKEVAATQDGSSVPAAGYFTSNELLEIINDLPRDEGLDLQSEFTAVLKRSQCEGADKQLAREQGDTIELTSNLLNSVLEDAQLTEITRAHIDKLKVPLLKTALLDSTFFTAPGHPARTFLNLFAQLGSTSGSKGEVAKINPELLRSIKRLADRLDNQLGSDNAIFAEAVMSLTPLVHRQDESFARNVERAIKACEGSQKIREARQATREAISCRIVGKALPDTFLTLLGLGWPKALVISYLRSGPDSKEWQKACSVLGEVLHRSGIEADENYTSRLDASELMDAIRQGLGYVSFDSRKIEKLLAELRNLLSTPSKASDQARVLIDQEMVDAQLGYSLETGSDVRRYGVDADISARSEQELSKWQAVARTLQCDDWVIMAPAVSDRQLLKLVWITDDQSHYCFVNCKGIKTLELSLKELAGLMLSGVLEPFQDAGLPLVDRGMHRMLQEMHEKLVLQATHDPLTGLLNRKEFCKRLKRALTTSRQTKTSHVLCHFDLDQFNVINNSCGHLAGDELLKQSASLFLEQLNDRADFARLGNDEFGLLIPDCTEAEGYQIADNLRSALETFRFVWKGTRHSVTVCIGLTLISEQSESVGDLLKAADSACYAAKNAGFNRIQRYQPDDAKLLRHKEVISWVARINTVLDADDLMLYCQQIAPLSQNSADKLHYEVLLRVTDDAGRTVAPASFIQAAELANRMQDVDRCIIRKTFGWMVENSDGLADLGGISINLSGCSLNDEGFLAYILQQFADSGAPAEKICFEVTETAAISNLANAADFIGQLKAIGCTFALDDFGSGLSSYSYLKHLPVDFLKIDGMFVRDILTSEADFAMVKSINELSHFLGKKTIAEYVENERIRDQLIEIGVDYAQGYAIEKPRCLNEIV